MQSQGSETTLSVSDAIIDMPMNDKNQPAESATPADERSTLPALAMVASELPPGNLRDAVLEMDKSIAGGASIEEAVAALDKKFPAHVGPTLAAGIRTGRLLEALIRMGHQEARTQQIWRTLWASTAYSLLLVGMAAAILLFFMLVPIPMFEEIFDDFALDLPGMTVAVIGISRAVRGCVADPYFWITVAVLFGLPLVVRLTMGRRVFDVIRFGIPLFGPLWAWTNQAQFSQLMSLLTSYQVSLPEALRMTGEGLVDQNLGRVCHRLADAVEKGRPLAECVAESSYFTRSLVPLAEWGQANSTLPEAFGIAGEVFEERARLQVDWLCATLPPITFIVVATAVAAMLTSLLMPLVDLITMLSR